MMTENTPRFIATPHAQARMSVANLIWPEQGSPAAFDAAAEAMYGCFDEPLAVDELADDLQVALGLAPDQATATAFTFVAGLVRSGHLVEVGAEDRHEAYSSYPPSASP